MSRQGAIFTAGPPVVKESTGEEISKEDLGGPSVALVSGVIHNLAEDDEAVLDDIRRYLSYFPASAWSYPSSSPASDVTCPGHSATVFVAFAWIGANPIESIAGKEINDPPPAIAFITPARNEAATSHTKCQ